MKNNKQADLIALCAIMVAATTAITLLRCWAVKINPNRRFGWDDGFAVATLVRQISE